MKTNNELRAALNMVLARLDGDDRTVEGWVAIIDALGDASEYAKKKFRLRVRSERAVGAGS